MGLITALWGKYIASIENQLDRSQYNTWIFPLKIDIQTTESLRLIAPNHFIANWVKDKYLHQIELFTRAETGKENFCVEIDIAENNSPSTHSTTADISTHLAPLNTDPTKIEVVATDTTTVTKQFVEKPPVNIELNNQQLFRNQSYTFENFVAGKSNQLAFSAAKQLATSLKNNYNPLVIYGPTALGKTHLMCAVGNELSTRYPDLKICYIRAEQFVSGMVKSLRMGAIDDFKNYYRSVNVLLVDDIHFLAKKLQSQEEFFHTYNSLIDTHQQMIFTCDRYPKTIDGLEERLKSRFGWGLTVEIEPPELEMRVAILMLKAQESNLILEEEVAFYIASKIKKNVRELEGALKRVVATARFKGEAITIPLVQYALRDVIAINKNFVTIEAIQQKVAEFYRVTLAEILSPRRKQSFVYARQVAMYLAKEFTEKSLPEIGKKFGGRDHTTVIHAYNKIKNLLSTSEQLQEDIKWLSRNLSG